VGVVPHASKALRKIVVPDCQSGAFLFYIPLEPFIIPSSLAIHAFKHGKRFTSLLSVFGAMKAICKGNRYRDTKENREAIGAVCGLSPNSVTFYTRQLLKDNWAYEKRGLIYLRSTRKIAKELGMGGRLSFVISPNDIHHKRLANAIMRNVGENVARCQKHYKKTITKNQAYLDKLVHTPSVSHTKQKAMEQSEDRWFATVCQRQQSDLVPTPRDGSDQKSLPMLYVDSTTDYFGISYSLFGTMLNRSKATMHRRMKRDIEQGLVVKQNVVKKVAEGRNINLLDFAQKNPEKYSRHRLRRENGGVQLIEILPNRYGFKQVGVVKGKWLSL